MNEPQIGDVVVFANEKRTIIVDLLHGIVRLQNADSLELTDFQASPDGKVGIWVCIAKM